MNTNNNTQSFKEQYSVSFVDKWDELIDWSKRDNAEGDFFVDILRENNAQKIIDVSTGSGFHSVKLAKNGFDVTATDGSAVMLNKAKNNFMNNAVNIPIYNVEWINLPNFFKDEKFDALICLGSSFCHVTDISIQKTILENFKKILKPGGLIIIDQRNFFAIALGNYASTGRFYYCGKSANVSIGDIDSQTCEFIYNFNTGESYKLTVYPILPQELASKLIYSGFKYKDMYGDFSKKHDVTKCDFVIHTAVVD